MRYVLERWEDHQECDKYMDTYSPTGWWCPLHNVNLFEPEEEA